MSLKLRILYAGAKVYWRIFKPRLVGVKIMFVRDGQVLLVRHTYEKGWHLPGGGVKRGEMLETAVYREADEELGATIRDITLLGVYSNVAEYKNDYIITVVSHDFTIGQPKDDEIAAYAFYPFDDLPPDAVAGTRHRVAEYQANQQPQIGAW